MCHKSGMKSPRRPKIDRKMVCILSTGKWWCGFEVQIQWQVLIYLLKFENRMNGKLKFGAKVVSSMIILWYDYKVKRSVVRVTRPDKTPTQNAL